MGAVLGVAGQGRGWRGGQRWGVASGGILEGQFNTLKPKLFFFSTRSKTQFPFSYRQKKNVLKNF